MITINYYCFNCYKRVPNVMVPKDAKRIGRGFDDDDDNDDEDERG